MNIRHLKIFIMVADYKNMSTAAEMLFISQPSVSQAIKEIEEYYGIKLFERLSKKLYITESGEMLLKYARHIVESFDEMETKLKNKGQKVCLRIGATITVGTCMLNDIINKVKEEHEDLSTKIVINNSNIIEKLILTSELDLGIVEGVVTNKDLIKKLLFKDKLVVVVGKGHKFYNRDEITIEELNGEDVISREEGSGSKNIFDDILRERNIEVNIKWISTNTEAIKNATINGQGLAVLSTLIVDKEIKEGTLKSIEISGIDMTREICIIYHKNKFISDHLKSFIESL